MENLTLEKVKAAEDFLKIMFEVNHSIKKVSKEEVSIKLGGQELKVPLNSETYQILYDAVRGIAGYSE
ncbi:MAG: hypothetical protein OSJ36_09860 [Odoribacter sp.]|nr:hypothetical protein [Odoribacter sp.]